MNKEHIGFRADTETVPLPDSIGEIELRNYVLKQGARDRFIDYFEKYFIGSQRILNGFPMGQYRIKGAEDHFFWIRAFRNRAERSTFLPAFYYGPYWKEHRNDANSMIANNDNVHLLRPVTMQGDSLAPAAAVSSALLLPKQGIAVVDLYIANTKRELLLQLFGKYYVPLLHEAGVQYSLWTCDPEPNDFPQLPVFQDKNLLATIAFYKDESSYKAIAKSLQSKLTVGQKAELRDAITTQQTLILYPTERTLKERNQE